MFGQKNDGRNYIWPDGIVLSGWQPEGVDSSRISEGYTLQNQSGNFSIEVKLQRSRFRELFGALIAILPSIDCLIATLLNHYDSHEYFEECELSENSVQCFSKDVDIPPVDLVAEFERLEKVLLGNGHVDFGGHSDEADCTIWLTEHKTLHITTSRADICEKMKDFLEMEARLPSFSALESCANCYSHYHYRPSGSLDASELSSWLRANGWGLVKDNK